ncbi:MAG: putative sugar phosphate isomerase YwlF [Planctomycetes bacterium ADurb.Bin126]|nr:MAG: putative sugar phosphate isomerase YwlF [Planctomycetes bacterium ADurb.Bin126]HOD84844.1 ribose 5-phosphate isomerase B [Phycisphaerae bacterium]HQL74280.1 ribose 5-phosphate isomerase B [Phycisphaerae bacterium]
MRIVIAADHRGHSFKDRIMSLLTEQNHQVTDLGTNSSRPCDYPDIAFPAARAITDGQADVAILICGSGIGMTISANKVPGVRAALCHDELTAQMSRRHNDANVLCLASDVMGEELMRRIVFSWLHTEFERGGRHERRVRKIGMIERGIDPRVYDTSNDGLGNGADK